MRKKSLTYFETTEKALLKKTYSPSCQNCQAVLGRFLLQLGSLAENNLFQGFESGEQTEAQDIEEQLFN